MEMKVEVCLLAPDLGVWGLLAQVKVAKFLVWWPSCGVRCWRSRPSGASGQGSGYRGFFGPEASPDANMKFWFVGSSPIL